MSYVDTLNAAYAEIERAIREAGGRTSYAPNRVPVTFDTTRKISTLTFDVNLPQDRVSGLKMLDVEIAPVSATQTDAFRVAWKDWRGDHDTYTTFRLDPQPIVTAYEDARGAYVMRGKTAAPLAQNQEPFSGYEQRIAKVANTAAQETGLTLGMSPDTVPMIDDDALYNARRALLARAPAHFERRINAFMSQGVRAYTTAILNVIGEEADRIKRVIGGSQYPPETKLRDAVRAQDLASLATRTYSRGAASLSSRDSGGYDAISDTAKAARRWVLSEYARNATKPDWQRWMELGEVAAAVLGTRDAGRIRSALAAGAFTIPAFGGINRYVTAVLNRAPDDEPFGPPLVVGWTYPRVVRDAHGEAKAVARADMYAVLHTPTGNAFLRDVSGDREDAFIDKIKAGGFEIENDDRGRFSEFPALILRTHLGGSFGYGGRTAASVLVPVGTYNVRHVSREDVGDGRALEDYLDMLTRDFKYQYSYGSKKDAEGREIGRAKSGGGIKWISPDPFAKR